MGVGCDGARAGLSANPEPETVFGQSRESRMSNARRGTCIVAVLAAVGLLALPAVSLAQATIENSSETYTVEPFPVDDTCAGAGVVGILTGTGTITRRIINTATNEHGTDTDTFDYRVDFADGS